MYKIMELIEKLRKESKVSKQQLCDAVKISRSNYYNYLKTNNVPMTIYKAMLDDLGYDIFISKKKGLTKL